MSQSVKLTDTVRHYIQSNFNEREVAILDFIQTNDGTIPENVKTLLDIKSLEKISQYGSDTAFIMAYERLRTEKGESLGIPADVPDLPKHVWNYLNSAAKDDECPLRLYNSMSFKMTRRVNYEGPDPLEKDHAAIYKKFNSKQLEYLEKYGTNAGCMMTYHRLLEEYGDTLGLAVCPKCDNLCRTPKTKQCPTCLHNWHEQS